MIAILTRQSVLAGCLMFVTVVAGVVQSHSAGAQTVQVDIVNFSFSQSPLVITAGTTVTWTNQDSTPHTSTSDSNIWSSPSLSQGQSYSYTFNTPGSFPYYCIFHANMHGVIQVQPSTQATSATGPTTANSTATASPVAPAAMSTSTPTTVPRPTATVAKPKGKSVQVLTKKVGSAYRFSPLRITVKRGTTVIWKNSSDAPHTVTSRTRSWKYDRAFGLKQRVSFTFKKAGTYRYYCKYHSGMAGTVVVTR